MITYEKTVSEHYSHGNLLKSIEAALPKLGKTINNVTLEDLAPVDEFHIGGRAATDNLLQQLNFTRSKHVLDIGCGLGGAARYVADKYENRVTGIDLTAELITGNDSVLVDIDTYADFYQVRVPYVEQIHYRWRNDDGGE